MANSHSGPQCSVDDPVNINDGTMCRAASPVPHVLGATSVLYTPVSHYMHAIAIDDLIRSVQNEFPHGAIRVTGRGRTVERQAQLMWQRRRTNRNQFLRTYRPAAHITEMDQWVADHPHASEASAVASFVEIINRARQQGAVVSNHLSDHARDISIPRGDSHHRSQIRHYLEQHGAHVIDEHDAVGGPHWHVDY